MEVSGESKHSAATRIECSSQVNAQITTHLDCFEPVRSMDKSYGQVLKADLSIIKPTLKRYVILFLFCLNTANKTFQWIQVPASTTKATIFYGVENYVINFASIIFMLAYLVVSWPACYMIDRIGIRRAILVASFGTILGSLVKCYSCYQAGIGLLLVGQAIIALSEQMIFQMPSRLASIWFPDHQVSSCVSICVLGNQMGIAIGFEFTQWLLHDATTHESLASGFWLLYLVTLIYSTVLFVFNWLLFDEAPKHAPGAARQRQIAFEEQSKGINLPITKSAQGTSVGCGSGVSSLIGQFRLLLKNGDYVLVALAYGMSVGRSDTISTLLDQIFTPIFPQDEAIIGNVGFLIISAGALGSPIWGRLLDKTRAYKQFNLIITVCSGVTLALFGYSLVYLRSKPAIYLSATIFGFFQTGSFVTGLELSVELTYPNPEMVTSSMMAVSGAFMAPVFIVIASFVVDNVGIVAANIFLLSTLAISILCILCIRGQLKRQAACETEAASKHQGRLAGTSQ